MSSKNQNHPAETGPKQYEDKKRLRPYQYSAFIFTKAFLRSALSCCHEQCCHVHLAALQGMAIRDIARHKGGTRSGQEDTRHWPAMVKRVIDLLIPRSHSAQYTSFLSFFPSYLERGYTGLFRLQQPEFSACIVVMHFL